MQDLPTNIEEANGLIIKVRTSVSDYTIANFGKDQEYVFTLQEFKGNEWKTDNQRIRVYPIENYPSKDKCHILATMLGYLEIRHKFQVVGKID